MKTSAGREVGSDRGRNQLRDDDGVYLAGHDYLLAVGGLDSAGDRILYNHLSHIHRVR